MILVLGETRFRRGTREFNPTATEQLAPTAKKYDFTNVEVLSGDDLFAFAELMATFRL